MRVFLLLLSVLLTGCMTIPQTGAGAATPIASQPPAATEVSANCPETEADWVKPPEDDAVNDPPAHGYYYVNPDRSIWASAWWTNEAYPLRVSEEGVKVGWFRPAGANLEITGQRIDGQAAPLEAHVPCCYPTRFQATGLYFPTAGCWEVTAKAAESQLSFIVWVEP